MLLKRGFLDSDQAIEKRTGVDIPTIFEFEGEEGFRRRETEMLRELLARENVVLATGGGIVMRPENRKLLKEHCVLYLRVPVAEQYRRTRKSRRRVTTGHPSCCQWPVSTGTRFVRGWPRRRRMAIGHPRVRFRSSPEPVGKLEFGDAREFGGVVCDEGGVMGQRA